MKTPAISKCHDSIMSVGFNHPHFLMIHARVRDLYREEQIGTMGVAADGTMLVDPAFVAKLDPKFLGGVVCHELLHLVLDSHGRRGNRDPERWNIATDMVINSALKQDGILLPDWCFYVPERYTGDRTAEALYDFLSQNPQAQPKTGQGKSGKGQGQGQGQGQPQVGAGCGPRPPQDGGAGQGQGQDGAAGGKGQSQPVNWHRVGIEARTMAQGRGTGTCAVADLLTPREPRTDWRKVLRYGVNLAAGTVSRDLQTFTRVNRRSPPGLILPGWRGVEPKIAIMIDVSGSMDRAWIEQIMGEIKTIAKQYPGTRYWLCTHTDDVTWQGWVHEGGTDAALKTATAFSGGTAAAPAYAALAATGAKFDVAIHFTDCEIERPWPDLPPRTRLVVGAFGSGATDQRYSQPPPSAVVLPCGNEES
jgi:predicted metal-dependent peptidase